MRQCRFIHLAAITSLQSVVLSPQDLKKNYPRTVFAASTACVLIYIWQWDSENPLGLAYQQEKRRATYLSNYPSVSYLPF